MERPSGTVVVEERGNLAARRGAVFAIPTTLSLSDIDDYRMKGAVQFTRRYFTGLKFYPGVLKASRSPPADAHDSGTGRDHCAGFPSLATINPLAARQPVCNLQSLLIVQLRFRRQLERGICRAVTRWLIARSIRLSSGFGRSCFQPTALSGLGCLPPGYGP